MHEMSVAMSLLEMAEMEAKKQNCLRLQAVTVQYGQISGIMPDALAMAFTVLVRGTPHENATLNLEMLPLRLRCPFCQTIFGGVEQSDIFAPCPSCGEAFGHTVIQGRELLLARIEALPE